MPFNCDLRPRKDAPTPAEAKQALMRLFGLTEAQFDKLHEQYRDSRISDDTMRWYFDPSNKDE